MQPDFTEDPMLEDDLDRAARRTARETLNLFELEGAPEARAEVSAGVRGGRSTASAPPDAEVVRAEKPGCESTITPRRRDRCGKGLEKATGNE